MPTPAEAVAHLLRRAGFGGTPSEVAALTRLDINQIVDRLVNVPDAPSVPPPALVLNETAGHWERRVAMVQAWFDRMATARDPLPEKMALFWHGHFTSSLEKCPHTAIWNQQQLLRTKGMGNFRALAQQVAVDPAMLRYLDNAENRRGAPNENFARELMELFLLGVGHYSQADVAESARAWTGHTINEAGQHVFRPDLHDGGVKTVFGIARPWTGPELIDEMLLGVRRDQSARFLARKLWSFFAYPNPEDTVVEGIVAPYLASNLDLRALLRAIFLRPEFYSGRAREGLVRSPVEYVVAAMRGTGLGAATVHPEWFLEPMGQTPYYPPNVSGWRQNAYWISTTAQWAKFNFAQYLRWQAGEAGMLEGSEELGTLGAARAALAAFGIIEPSTATLDAISDHVERERRNDPWAERPNLILLAMLSPEMQLA